MTGVPPPGGQTQGAPPGRPVSIFLTVACAFAGLADLQGFAFAFSRRNREAFAATPYVNGVVAGIALLQIACLVLLWRGRRAGLFGFLGLAVIHVAVLLPAVGAWSLCALLPSVLVGAAGLWNWERLR